MSVRYTWEPGVRFSDPGRAVIDCAVVRLGDTWHYTAPRGRPQDGAYHAVSDDGLTFKRVDDIPSAEGENWLGNLLEWDGGMRFYGNAARGLWWAFSADGRTWTRPTYVGQHGGDPAVVRTAEGRVPLIYTSESRRRGLPPGIAPWPPLPPREPPALLREPPAGNY